MNGMPETTKSSFYLRLSLIAGLGGLLYGVDIRIFAAALLYLGKVANLTVGEKSPIVAAVLGGGSMVASPVAGLLAAWFSRKRMMAAVITLNPAIHYQFKTGQRDWPKT